MHIDYGWTDGTAESSLSLPLAPPLFCSPLSLLLLSVMGKWVSYDIFRSEEECTAAASATMNTLLLWCGRGGSGDGVGEASFWTRTWRMSIITGPALGQRQVKNGCQTFARVVKGSE